MKKNPRTWRISQKRSQSGRSVLSTCLKSLRGYYTSEASSMAPGVDGDEFPDEIESRLVGIFGCTNQSYQGIGLSFKIEQKRIRVS